MYNYNDKKAAVSALQNMLYRISKDDETLPNVYVDGIYGKETAECVRLIQARNSIKETGTVDFESFECIREEYFNSISEPISKVDILPAVLNDGVIREGEESTTVVILQSMLQELSYIYDECESVKLNGIIDSETVVAIKKIQQVHEIKETGEVDTLTWNAIVIEYERFRGED